VKIESRIIMILRKEFRFAVIFKAIDLPKTTHMYYQENLNQADLDKEIIKLIKFQ